MSLLPMKAVLAATIFPLAMSSFALGDTFGAGANTFDIEFVTIGNPGNVADITGDPSPAGSVAYTYNLGKYEISRDMVIKANAAGDLQISLADMTAAGGNGVNRPAAGITWNAAAQFVNWLNTSTGYSPAYKFVSGSFELWTPSDVGYDPNNLFRNRRAKYVLPNANEWYKAAYYDPVNGFYNDFPTASFTTPVPVPSGTTADTAVYNQSFGSGPADIMLAGGPNPYGTVGQGGNVWEWEETESDLVNNSTLSNRIVRGGGWTSIAASLWRENRLANDPFSQYLDVGFRVASIVPKLGDYNHDGIVDAADYVAWRKNDGTQTGYDTWRSNFSSPAGNGATLSAIPEPSTLLLAIAVLASLGIRRRKVA